MWDVTLWKNLTTFIFINLFYCALLHYYPSGWYFTIADVYNAMSGNTMPQRIMYRLFMLWMLYVLYFEREIQMMKNMWSLYYDYVRFSNLRVNKNIKSSFQSLAKLLWLYHFNSYEIDNNEIAKCDFLI